jgi:hypothetical protein
MGAMFPVKEEKCKEKRGFVPAVSRTRIARRGRNSKRGDD